MILIEATASKGALLGYNIDGMLVARECTSCKDYKSISFFHKDSNRVDGVMPICKQCRKDVQAAKPKARKRYYRLDENNALIERECTDCRSIKLADEFSSHSHCPGGKYTVCRPCKAIQDTIHRSENVEQYKIAGQMYYVENRETISKRVKEWRNNNPDKVVQHDRRIDRDIVIHKSFSKEMRKIKRQVKALNKGKTKALEKVCMDHIIPLNGEGVSGLNVPWNTQLLSWSENAVKSNKFDWTYENESWREDYQRLLQIKSGEFNG